MGGFESVADYNPLPALQTYPGPVRCVISDLNTLAYSLHRLLPEMPLRQISGASHWLMMDRPDELWDALVDSLEEIYVGSTAKDLQS